MYEFCFYNVVLDPEEKVFIFKKIDSSERDEVFENFLRQITRQDSLRWIPVIPVDFRELPDLSRYVVVFSIGGLGYLGRDILCRTLVSKAEVESVLSLSEILTNTNVYSYHSLEADCGFVLYVVGDEVRMRCGIVKNVVSDALAYQVLVKDVYRPEEATVDVAEKKEVSVEKGVEERKKEDLFVPATERQKAYLQDVMKKAGFSPGIVESFLEVVSKEEASSLIDIIKADKISEAVKFVSDVIRSRKLDRYEASFPLEEEGDVVTEEEKRVGDAEELTDSWDFSEDAEDLIFEDKA